MNSFKLYNLMVLFVNSLFKLNLTIKHIKNTIIF